MYVKRNYDQNKVTSKFITNGFAIAFACVYCIESYN